MFKEIQEHLKKHRGGNTNMAFVTKDEVDEEYQCGHPNSVACHKQACFAETAWGRNYFDEGKNSDILYIIYDIGNVKRVYFDDVPHDETSEKYAYDMCRTIFLLPYLRHLFKNTSFKDAYENGLIIDVKKAENQAHLFLGMYLMRHVFECGAWKAFMAIHKRFSIPIREAAMLGFYFSGKSHVDKLEKEGMAGGIMAGHSATCSSIVDLDYMLSIVMQERPTFPGKHFWNCSPLIMRTMGGVLEYEKPKTPIPVKETGVGWGKQHLYDVNAVVEKLKQLKKGIK